MDSQGLSAAVFVSGYCDSCESGSILANDVSNRRRNLASEDHTSEGFGRLLQEDPLSFCFCPIGAEIIEEQLTLQEFEEAVEAGLKEKNISAVITKITETVPDDCDLEAEVCLSGELSFLCTDPSQFVEVVIIDFEYSCAIPPDLTDPVVQRFASQYMDTFNALQASYCDTQVKTITSAMVVRVGEFRNGQQLPIEIEVTGTCRNCNGGNSVDIYEFPSFADGSPSVRRDLLALKNRDSKSQARRNQEETDNECFCDADALATTGFNEAEFIDSFQADILNLQLDCFAGGLGSCAFGTPFATDIVVEFVEGSVGGTQEELTVIQNAFRKALNDLYAANANTCNPGFPVMEEVLASSEFVYNEFNVSATRRRKLQTETPPPSQSSNSTVSSQAPSQSSSPSSAPTFTSLQENVDLVLLSVSGVCNDCGGTLPLANDVVDGRRLLKPHQQRWMQDGVEEVDLFVAVSKCYCPIGSALIEITLGMVIAAVEEDGALPPGIILGAQVVDRVKCGPTRVYRPSFGVVLKASNSLTAAGYSQLTQTLLEAYKNVRQTYCDPESREVISFTPVQSYANLNLLQPCQQLNLEYFVSGTCRGDPVVPCGELFGSRGERLLEEVEEPSSSFNFVYAGQPGMRMLEGESSQCICSSGLKRGLPSESEFTAAVNNLVNIQGIGCVCEGDPNGQPQTDNFNLLIASEQELILGQVLNLAARAAEAVCRDLKDQCLAECLNVQTQVVISGTRKLQNTQTVVNSIVIGTGVSSLSIGGAQAQQRAVTEAFALQQCQYIVAFDQSKLCIVCSDSGSDCQPTILPPSVQPTTLAPTDTPTDTPSEIPTDSPTEIPTFDPTATPTSAPSRQQTATPTATTTTPTAIPTISPSGGPTGLLSSAPSSTPATVPSNAPTALPSPGPSPAPSSGPTAVPSLLPSTCTNPPLCGEGLPCCNGFLCIDNDGFSTCRDDCLDIGEACVGGDCCIDGTGQPFGCHTSEGKCCTFTLGDFDPTCIRSQDCCVPDSVCELGFCCQNTTGATCDDEGIFCCPGFDCNFFGECQQCKTSQETCSESDCCVNGNGKPYGCNFFESKCCIDAFTSANCTVPQDCCESDSVCKSGNCCQNVTGATCNNEDIVCCPGFECNSGTCQQCKTSQEICVGVEDCCVNGDGEPYSCNNGKCCIDAFTFATCAVSQDCCESDSVCKSGICCQNVTGATCNNEDIVCCPGFECNSGTCQQCKKTGDNCVEGDDCCVDVNGEPSSCNNAKCCIDTSSSATCSSDDDCCGLESLCIDNGETKTCCEIGSFCDNLWGPFCCNGFNCIDGQCALALAGAEAIPDFPPPITIAPTTTPTSTSSPSPVTSPAPITVAPMAATVTASPTQATITIAPTGTPTSLPTITPTRKPTSSPTTIPTGTHTPLP
jgi:hypothetical protein